MATRNTLIVMALTILLCLGSAGLCLAQCPIVEKCNFVDSYGRATPYWLQILPSSSGDWPVPYVVKETVRYIWQYQLTSNLKIPTLLTLAPMCCPKIDYFVGEGGVIYPVGVGDKATRFGWGNYQEQAVQLAVSPKYTNTYSFVTGRKEELRNTTFILKEGTSTFFCRNIAGPDCKAASRYSPDIKLEEFFVEEVKIRVTWDENNPCDASVFYQTPLMEEFKPADLVDILISTRESDGQPSPLVECGAVEGNQRCQRCRFTSKGSPTYTYIKIGGRTYKVCICDCPSTPKCR